MHVRVSAVCADRMSLGDTARIDAKLAPSYFPAP